MNTASAVATPNADPGTAPPGAEPEVTEPGEQPPESANYRPADDPEKSCAMCQHFEDGLCNLYKAKVSGEMVSDGFARATDAEERAAASTEGEPQQSEYYNLAEVYMADTAAAVKDNGLVWKEVLREGEWALSPDGLTGVPVEKPIEFVLSGTELTEDRYKVGLTDIVDAFNEGAVNHVTVPVQSMDKSVKEHTDSTLQNTGFVRELVLGKGSDNLHHVYAGIEFTEPDIEEKVLRGTIPDTSAGLKFNHRRKSDGKTYPVVMEHNALTHRPWINGMQPFGAFLADNEDATVISLAQGGTAPPNPTGDGGDGEEPGERRRPSSRRAPVTAKNLLKQAQVRRDLALAEIKEQESPRGGETMGAENGLLEGLGLSEEQEQKISSVLDAQNETVESLRKQVHQRNVDERIEELKGIGFSEFPGVLKRTRELMLADDSGTALLLSEEQDGKPVEARLTVTDVVNEILDAFPKDDDSGKLKLSEQALGNLGLSDATKPPANEPGDSGKSDVERAQEAAEWLGDEKYIKSAQRGGEE